MSKIKIDHIGVKGVQHETRYESKAKTKTNCNFLLHFKVFPDDCCLNCKHQVTLVVTVFTFIASHCPLNDKIILMSALF